jgi:hypothetical protein
VLCWEPVFSSPQTLGFPYYTNAHFLKKKEKLIKKLFFIFLIPALCPALATPAMAKASVYGLVLFDAYYWRQSAEAVAGGVAAGAAVPPGVDDLSTVNFNMPKAYNRFGLRWANDDNTLRARVELRGGGIGGGSVAGGDAYLNYAWIDWQLSPNFYLRLGRQTQAFAIMYATTLLGASAFHTLGLGYGNVHGGSSRDSIRGYFKFSDTVRMEVQLLDPDSSDPPELTLPSAGSAAGTTTITATASEENTIPRIDVAVPITFGNWVIEPSGSLHTSNYAQVFPGTDDSYDSWGLALGIKAGFGIFSFTGEITVGENLAGAGYGGCFGCGPLAYVKGAGSPARGIEDTQALAWFAQIDAKFRDVTLRGIYGQQRTENDGNPAVVGDENERTRRFYGVVLFFPGFTIIPGGPRFFVRHEIMFYDNDDSALVSGTRTDFGNELIAGVNVLLRF